eukprot:6496108-Prymnesium_polylepis.1
MPVRLRGWPADRRGQCRRWPASWRAASQPAWRRRAASTLGPPQAPRLDPQTRTEARLTAFWGENPSVQARAASCSNARTDCISSNRHHARAFAPNDHVEHRATFSKTPLFIAEVGSISSSRLCRAAAQVVGH